MARFTSLNLKVDIMAKLSSLNLKAISWPGLVL